VSCDRSIWIPGIETVSEFKKAIVTTFGILGSSHAVAIEIDNVHACTLLFDVDLIVLNDSETVDP
jgi:hypothetical protein